VSPLRAAAAAIDLAPPPGCWLTGFAFRVSPSEGQHDPVMARALLFDDGASRLLCIACDLIGIDARTVHDLRTRIAARTNVAPHEILIACTHTHSAPATMRFRGVLGYVNERWWQRAQERIVDLAASLPAQLRPARIALTATDVPGISYNRQDRARPHDTELLTLAVDGTDGAAIATVLNYAVHPVTLSHPNLLVSGDVPGRACETIAARRGGTALYLQGACGDVNPSSDLNNGWGTGTFDDVARVGDALAQAALDSLTGASWESEAPLACESEMLALPLDPAPSAAEMDAILGAIDDELRAARAAGDAGRESWQLGYMRWAGELMGARVSGRVPTTHTIEVWRARIGALRIAAVPLEPYSDIGLDYKRAFPPGRAMFVGYANGLLGYCATDWAKDQGGYGPNDACRWFPEQLTAVGRGAAQRVSAAARDWSA